MTVFDITQQAVGDALVDLWVRFAGFIPRLLGALIVFIVGWLIAVAVGHFITRLLKLLRLNDPFERISGFRSTLERASIELNVPGFMGTVAKWFVVLVTLLATADILELQAIASFLNQVIAYIPNLVAAAVILVMGILFANFVARVTRASIEAANIPHGAGTAAFAKWAVFIFTFLAALVQLQVAEVLIQTLFTAFAAMLAIAGGLAFGLGGKDHAQRMLQKLESDIQSHHR